MRKHNLSPVISNPEDVKAFVKSLTEPPTEEQQKIYNEIASGVNDIKNSRRKRAVNEIVEILRSNNESSVEVQAELIMKWIQDNRVNHAIIF